MSSDGSKDLSSTNSSESTSKATVGTFSVSRSQQMLRNMSIKKTLMVASAVSVAGVAVVVAQTDPSSGIGIHTKPVVTTSSFKSALHTPTTSAADATNLSQSAAGSSTTSTSVNNNGGKSTVSVTINGEPVSVPQNGTTEQTVTNPDGSNTSYSISNNSTSSGTGFNSSVSTQNIATTTTLNSFSTEQIYVSP